MNMNEQQTKTLEQIAFEAQAVLQRLGGEWISLHPDAKHEAGDEFWIEQEWKLVAEHNIGLRVGFMFPCRRRIRQSSSHASESESLPPGFIEAVQAKSGFTNPFEAAPEVHVAMESGEWKPKFKQGDIVKKPGHGEATGEVGFVCWDERTVQVRWVNPTGGFTHTTTERNQDALELVSSRESPFLTPDELRALCGGQEPHRLDGWRREWLTDGWRPLLMNEDVSAVDEYRWNGLHWKQFEDDLSYSESHSAQFHRRTRRPLPQPPATPAGEDKPSMEQMESSIDQLSKRCGFPVVLDRIQVLNTIGNRVEKLDRMLNEKIEQLQQLTQELASANEQATLSANHAKHHQQRLHEAYETMVIHSKNYETHKEKLMEEIKDLEMRTAGERAKVAELTRERDEAKERAQIFQEECANVVPVFKEMQSRAEAAEKKLAEVEKDRDAWRDAANNPSMVVAPGDKQSRVQMYIGRIQSLEQQLSRLTWTPISTRLPTKEDAIQTAIPGDWVLWSNADGPWVGYLEKAEFDGKPATHFMSIPPLPTPPEEDTAVKASWNTFVEWVKTTKFPPMTHNDLFSAFLAGQQSK